jgi:hypothetical protein
MSTSAINSLLNRYSSSCISPNNNFTTEDPLGFSGGNYQFGDEVSAGQAILDIAQNYHINPQVILTTLQKEQSVVTGELGCHPNTPDPSQSQNSPCGTAKTPCTEACTFAGGCLPIATSYSCPNYCYAGIEGFSNQLSGGTWLLRFAEQRAYGRLTGYAGYDAGDETYTYTGPMTPGDRKRSSTDTLHYYDGAWTDNNGNSVTITNGATASLYTYTPFINDTHFSTIFSSWFGNPAADLSKDIPLVGNWNGAVSGQTTPAARRGTAYFLDNNNDGQVDTTVDWGRSTDEDMVGDWDGNNKSDLGLRRGTTYYLDYDQNGKPNKVVSWGRSSDTDIVGDWNGDGITDLGLRRGTTYYLDYDQNGKPNKIINWGRDTDSVILGDFNGDGKTDIGLRRGHTYYLDYNQNGTQDVVISWGRDTDQALVGDWNGAKNGSHKIYSLGLRRGTVFYLDYDKDGKPDVAPNWGRTTDKARVGDWNGDGRDTIGLKRVNFYYFDNNSNGSADVTFYYTY